MTVSPKNHSGFDHAMMHPIELQSSKRTPVLETKAVGVQLADRYIVRDVNLSIGQNEILSIIGPSGCGKSTFISTLNRMTCYTLPEAKVHGEVYLKGELVSTPMVNETSLRKKIGMVFQRPNPFPFSVRHNMEFALKATGNYRRTEYDDKIEEALSMVKLWNRLKDHMNDPATCLSGGEQQRLCIARALMSDPDVILFDEPCSALDPISSTAVEDLISSLKERCAVIIVTHNLAQARRIADRCAVFWVGDDCGEVIEEGPIDQVMNNPNKAITRAYINGEFC
jgi:phosphate transport system ATP-binding protein